MSLANQSLAIDDTIVALASAPGGSVEGIIRLSGPAVVEVLQRVWKNPIDARSATVLTGSLRVKSEYRSDVSLPGMVYLWPTSRSYTRQPLAEIYLPGSPPLLDLAIRTLCQSGARLARPGEFTLRAFLAGRLDLTQAEAVLGVIEARDAAELHTALTQLAGGLSHQLAALRNQLLDLLAHLEAGLDFVDEDIEFITRADLQSQVAAAAKTVRTIADQLQSRGETSATTPRVVLLGEPNAGKSSLLNALAGSATAIVSPVAGTTRDYLVRNVTFGQQNLQLIDTAGIETAATDDAIASTAQEFSQNQQAHADLQLLCIDASQPLSNWSREQLAVAANVPRLIVLTKCDQVSESKSLPSPALRTSALTGSGIAELRTTILAMLQQQAGETRCYFHGHPLQCQPASSRHRMQTAADLSANAASEEWIAAELRLALDELGLVVGAIYTDDILDRVFSRFCIGK